jgi:hypothetical protein
MKKTTTFAAQVTALRWSTVRRKPVSQDADHSVGYLGGILQRDLSASGRYRVRPRSTPRDERARHIEYWRPDDLPSRLSRESGRIARGMISSGVLYEIINSRRDPREFAGRVLPSDPSLYERVHHEATARQWTSKECADRTCKGWVCEDHAVTCSECNETFHAHCVAVLPDGQTPVCRECLKNVPADIISEVAA